MQLHSRETYDGGVRVFGMQSAFATHGDLWVTARSWKQVKGEDAPTPGNWTASDRIQRRQGPDWPGKHARLAGWDYGSGRKNRTQVRPSRLIVQGLH